MAKPNRKRAEGILHRHETPEMEWAQRGRLHDLVSWRPVAEAAHARTGGRCYVEGCERPITAYPHAIPMWEGGVHDVINRAGVCAIHAEEIHSSPGGNGPPREYLRRWLQTWYSHEMTADQWEAAARGETTEAAG